jgi:hypothetical protein
MIATTHSLNTLPNLPSYIINIILDFRSDLSDSKWIPYLDVANDRIHETVKFKLNIRSSWFKNNIDKLLHFKIKNPPAFKTVFMCDHGVKDASLTTKDSVVSQVKVITYFDDTYKQKICLDFVSGGDVNNSNSTGWAAYANIAKMGYRRNFIDGFYYSNSNEILNKTSDGRPADCSKELISFSDKDSKLFNRIDVTTYNTQYLSSFVVTTAGWSRDFYDRDLEIYE